MCVGMGATGGRAALSLLLPGRPLNARRRMPVPSPPNADTKLTQQELSACKPVLDPTWVRDAAAAARQRRRAKGRKRKRWPRLNQRRQNPRARKGSHGTAPRCQNGAGRRETRPWSPCAATG